MVRDILHEEHGNINSNLETEMPTGLATKHKGPEGFDKVPGRPEASKPSPKATNS